MSLRLCCNERGDRYRKSAKGYREGGARGEVARETAEETEPTKGTTSSRFVTGTMATTGDRGVSTEPVAEQTGQICEAVGAAVSSTQKWNCAQRNNAKMRMR